MHGFTWAKSWLEAYRATHTPHVLVAKQSGNVCGIFPLAETVNAWTGQTLELIGSGKVCTDYLDVLCEKQHSDALATAFCDYLCSTESDSSSPISAWDHLNLDGIADTNLTVIQMLKLMERKYQTPVSAKPGPHCWSVPLPNDWNEYKMRLSNRARKMLKNSEAELASQRSTFEIAQTLEQTQHFLSEIESIHQTRWSERNVVGCFGDKAFRNFVQSLVARLWEENTADAPQNALQTASSSKLLVGLLRIDGQPASGTICFRELDSIAMYLTGMDPRFSEVRPGWQITTCFLQYAIKNRVNRFDFLRGNEDYKARLGASPTAQRRWLVSSPRRISQIRGNVYRTAAGVKSWWNSWQMPANQSEFCH